MAEYFGKLITFKPQLMSEEYFIEICKKLNIPTDDMNMQLNKDYYHRIIYNKDIIVAQYNAKLYNLYKEQITKIQSVETKNKHMEEVQKVVEEDFKSKRDKIRTIEDAQGVGVPHDLYSGFEVSEDALIKNENLAYAYHNVANASNNIRPSKINYEVSKAKSDFRDQMLNALYKGYDELKGKEVYSTFANNIKKKKLKKLEQRISNLQMKQATAFVKQNKIINKNVKKYIEKRYRVFDAMTFADIISKNVIR